MATRLRIGLTQSKSIFGGRIRKPFTERDCKTSDYSEFVCGCLVQLPEVSIDVRDKCNGRVTRSKDVRMQIYVKAFGERFARVRATDPHDRARVGLIDD